MNITILDDYHDTLRTLAMLQQARRTRRSRSGTTTSRTSISWRSGCGHRSAGADPRAHQDPRAAARAAAEAPAHQPAQRLSAYRHRCLHEARHHRLVGPACRHAVLCHGGADLGPGARGDAPDPAADGSLQGGQWQIGVGHTLRGKTLGIYGYGRIGERGRGLRQGVRHERAGLGARGVAGAGARGRLRGRGRARRHSSSTAT